MAMKSELITESKLDSKEGKDLSVSYPRLARLTESDGFNHGSLALILLSAMVLGFETDRTLYQTYQQLFVVLDRAILGLFTIEIALRMLARLPKPVDYFRDGWNIFDCAIVIVCYLPFSGQYAAVLRLLRVLRTLRLLTHIPKLRLIVETMLHSMSSIGYIAMLLGLLFYVYGIIAVFVFGEAAPEYFGSLSTAALTLFQIVTLEGWAEVLKELKAHSPWAAPLFLVSFIILGTMIVLNLFIGVIVNSLAEAQANSPVDDKRNAAEELSERVALLHRRIDEIAGRSTPGITDFTPSRSEE